MNIISKKATLLLLFIVPYIAQAQDGLDIDVDLADDSPGIFENPLFWVGVGVFILILALILRSRKA